VARLLGLMAAGETRETILEAYPYLEPGDIDEALRYAAFLRRTRPSHCGRRRRRSEISGRHAAIADFGGVAHRPRARCDACHRVRASRRD
jgi:hypothetical protein